MIEPVESAKPTSAAAQEAAERIAVPPPCPQSPKPMVVPSGTILTIRTGQALGSKISQVGRLWTMLA